MKIICIIPAFNEEKNIAKTVAGVKEIFSSQDIVVVDDGSSDRTYDEAEKSGAVVLRHIVNRGQGAALATGNLYALRGGYDAAVHFDADGQFVPGEIPALLEPIIKGECDVSLGSRFIQGDPQMPWTKKHVLFPIAHLVNYILMGVKLSDPQSGFRALGRKALQDIRIEQDGSAHCSEILYKAARAGLRLKEVPMTVIYNEYGQSLFAGKGRRKGGIQIVKDLIMGRLVD